MGTRKAARSAGRRQAGEERRHLYGDLFCNGIAIERGAMAREAEPAGKARSERGRQIKEAAGGPAGSVAGVDPGPVAAAGAKTAHD